MVDWDVEYNDEDTMVAYRIKVGNLTTRQGRQLDVMNAEIVQRDEFAYQEDGTLSNDVAYTLLQLQRYPMLLNATRMSEHAQITEDDPETWEWKKFKLTEEIFWDLPETMSLEWYEVCIQKNPHRNITLQQLLKSLQGSALLPSDDT
jgi:hypothetical protein